MTADGPIAVVGIGNMGMSVLCALLSRGLSVVAVDRDEEKLAALRRGKSVVPEQGADAILATGLADGRLAFASDSGAASQWGPIFIAVQTPADGASCDYGPLRRVVAEIAQSARPGQLLIIGSTVFPGAIEREILPLLTHSRIELAYQPVFLRAGFGIDDYLHPGKTIVGVTDPRQPSPSIVEFFAAALIDASPTFVTFAESEWIKVVHNAFMSMKIAFANEIALLCESHGVDAARVIDLTLSESPRGRLLTRSHTKPGVPFSGPCLPKDAAILAGMVDASPRAAALEGGLCAGLARSNQAFRRLLIERFLELGTDPSRPLGIVGMSFRPGFNEMRHGLALDFLHAAREAGREVIAYDPAFEVITPEDYRLACRQDTELLGLYSVVRRSLEEVWQSAQGLLLNRELNEHERARIRSFPTPRVLDLYDNGLTRGGE